jgi:iron complex outermembrane receptor protein
MEYEKMHNKLPPPLFTRLLSGLLCVLSGSALAGGVTEADYFSELPEVLTVTRLAQPLSETPGAVTIIDRETIRRSGAREVADVLRLVPGYMVSGYNGAHPTAAYHAPIDEYGVRNLVLIDGRTVYSTYFLGGTHNGMTSVMLDDIERIEVLRGSNSAAYGANAMFGVINIITRHAADTHGAEVSVTGGEGGIEDNYTRIGWGNDKASFRLSTGRRKDSGYLERRDDKIISQLHFRGDLRPAVDRELRIAAGVTESSLGEGVGKDGNPLRTTGWRSIYLQGEWRAQLSGTDELKLTASFDEEHYRDRTAYAPDPSVMLDYGGRARRTNLELQHTLGIVTGLRAVWGMGYKQEAAVSPPLYARQDAVDVHEERVFGNLEWRPHPQWLVNAGGFWGRHSWTGAYFSPRLMANFHMTPDHTLRLGASKSERTPTLFELASDVRYYPKSLTSPFPFPRLFAMFNMPIRTFAASGNVDNEKLSSQEIGYFGNFRNWRMTLDVRAYIERMKDLIAEGQRTIPGYNLPVAPFTPIEVSDFMNGHGFKLRGIEYQLRWKPFNETELWVNQNFSRLVWDDKVTGDDRTDKLPPTRMTTLALFQKLPANLDLSLMYHSMGAMNWGSNPKDALPNRRRVDARLAMPFRVGSTRAEAAFAVQAASGNYPEYFVRQGMKVERRAYGTLRIEF